MPKNLAESLANTQTEDSSVAARWNQSMELLSKSVTPQAFRTWIKPIIPVNFIDEQLFLRIPSQFFFEWLEAHFRDALHQAVKKVFGLRTKIEYIIASGIENTPESLSLETDSTEPKNNSPVTSDAPAPANETPEEFDSFDERYNFDNFYTQNDNELAYRAALAVAKKPGKTDYNPLLIYGDSGCGKTHLMNAIANDLARKKKKKKICYISCENFLNGYISALQNRTLDAFNKKHSSFDVFLLDDIQYLSGKKKTQEGLYFILSELERKRKQVIITAYQAPSRFLGFEKKIISFFQKGLIVDLISPSYETRLQFIDEFCKHNELVILPEVREFLARIVENNLQQLRAVMIRISAHSSLLGKPVSAKKASHLLSQIDPKWAVGVHSLNKLQGIKIEKIIKTVSEYLSTPVDILIGHSRQREVVFARQVAIYLSKTLCGESLKVIGYHFGDRHHTGILHNFRKIEKELHTNPMLNTMLSEIKKKLSEQ